MSGQRRWLRFLAPVLLLAACACQIGPTAQAHAAGVLLRYRFTAGQHFVYLASAHATRFVVATFRSPFGLLEQLPFFLSVTGVDPDGTIQLLHQSPGGAIWMNQLGSLPLSPTGWQSSIHPDGSAASATYPPSPAISLLPASPVSAGSQWWSPTPLLMPDIIAGRAVGLDLKGEEHFRLTGFARLGTRQVAIIQTHSSDRARLTLWVGSVTYHLDGIVTSSGSMRRFVDNGELLDQDATATIDGTITGGQGSSPVPVHIGLAMTVIEQR